MYFLGVLNLVLFALWGEGAFVTQLNHMAQTQKLAWYYNRLKAMSITEIRHRVVERLKKNSGAVPDFISELHPPYVLPRLKGLSERWREAAKQPALLDEWRELAKKVQENQFHFLGVSWPKVVGQPDWHRDPVSCALWPNRPYTFDINYRHNHGMGDIKYVWELNRLQYLQPIAALAAAEKDGDLAQFCIVQLLDWIEHNPPWRGVNWNSGIELSLRVISILTLTTLLDAAFTDEQKQPVLRTLYQHGYWLARFPSKFSSANNHRVAEGAALYLLGVSLTPSPRVLGWLEEGFHILEEEAQLQIHADGIGAEQSPTYTAFSLEFFLLAGAVSREQERQFSPAYWARLEACGAALRAFLDKEGNFPRIGDDDEGRVVFSGFKEPDYMQNVLTMLAAALQKPELLPPKARSSLRTLVFGALPAAAPSEPISMRHSFTNGGYTVCRDTLDNDRERLFVIDHAPLGYLSIAAHGHADAGAIWLHLDGQPILVDAGTYLYHAGGVWRDHFRGTAAHNTVSVGDSDSSTIVGAFNWSQKAKARLTSAALESNDWNLAVEHDGYKKRYGVVHRRTVAARGAALELTDSLDGKAEASLPVALHFLLHPDVTARIDNGAVVVEKAGLALLRLDAPGGLTLELCRGSETPKRGWYSPCFGVKQPATLVRCSGLVAAGQALKTTITCY
jgi:hypothetical protein